MTTTRVQTSVNKNLFQYAQKIKIIKNGFTIWVL